MVKDKKPINDQNFDDFSIKTEGTYKNELGALENQLKKNIVKIFKKHRNFFKHFSK